MLPDISVLLTRANEAHRTGNLNLAASLYGQILARKPRHPDAMHLLGLVQLQMGNAEAAFRLISDAIRQHPRVANYFNSLGVVYDALRQPQEALTAFAKAARLNRNCADPQVNIGRTLIALGRHEQAVHHLEMARELMPTSQVALNFLGLAVGLGHDHEAAVKLLEQAVQLDPSNPDPYINLGTILRRAGRLQESELALSTSVQLSPQNCDAHWNLALTLLTAGRMEEGWQEFEWRWGTGHVTPRVFFTSKPVWKGELLHGARLLIHAEQGLGDTIQFARFIPLAKKSGATVVVECQAPLMKLLRTAPGIDCLVEAGQPLPEFDVHVPLMSLAGVTRSSLLPTDMPYLTVESKRRNDWKKVIDEVSINGNLRVGLCMAGNPKKLNDSERSIAPSQFARLVDTSDVKFFSLQNSTLPDSLLLTHNCRQLIGPESDICDTAAIIANLDLVITVDTMVAHLAGALGVEVWMLVPAVPDWRWQHGRDDSPWYPSMRLFRQSAPGRWDSTISEVATRLKGQLAARGS